MPGVMNMSDPKGINFLPKSGLLEFAADAEPWAQYKLENGAILRVRTVLVKVAETGQFTPDGFPIYNTRLEQMMDMTWPQDMIDAASARAKASENKS